MNEEQKAYEPGFKRIADGRCPVYATHPMACFTCRYGHMMECHHPYDCEEADCSHYRAAIEADDAM